VIECITIHGYQHETMFIKRRAPSNELHYMYHEPFVFVPNSRVIKLVTPLWQLVETFEDIDFLIKTITFDGEYPLTKIGWFQKLKTMLNNSFNTVKQYIGMV